MFLMASERYGKVIIIILTYFTVGALRFSEFIAVFDTDVFTLLADWGDSFER